MIATPKISFTAGELAPWLYARIDLDAYMKGASHLENFIVRPFGGISRREGTEWIAWTKQHDSTVRLFPFKYSMEEQFILEFGIGYIRFIKDKQLLSQNNIPYELESPWKDDNALNELSMTQVNDVIYCVSPSAPPHMLARHGELDWRLTPLTLEQGPWEDTSRNKEIMQYQMLGNESALVRLVSREGIFTKEMVNKAELLRLSIDRPEKIYNQIGLSAMNGVVATTAHPGMLAIGDLTNKLHTTNMKAGYSFYQALNGWYYYFTSRKQWTGATDAVLGADARAYPEFFTPGVVGGIDYGVMLNSMAVMLNSIDLNKRVVIRAGQILKTKDSLFSEYILCLKDFRCWRVADGGDVNPNSERLEELYRHRDFFDNPHVFRYPDFPFDVRGGWEITTEGSWDAEWEVRRSYDAFRIDLTLDQYDWSRIRSFSQGVLGERKNFSLSGVEEEPCLIGIFCLRSKSLTVASMGNPVLKTLGARAEMVVSLKNDESKLPNEVVGHIKNQSLLYDRSGISNQWGFSSFGVKNGYPRCVALHQGRLWFGGTQAQPTTVWGSKSDDLLNFQLGANAADALNLTMLTNNQNPICWLQAQRDLMLGTRESEWTLKSSDSNPLAPLNVSLSKETNVGSHFAEALNSDNTLFFIERGGRKIRELGFRLEIDSYHAYELSLLSEHLFHSGIKAWTLQRAQSLQVWTVQHDGTIAVLTRNPEQNISAWSKMSIAQAEMQSITSIHGQESWEDELWCITKRKIGGKIHQAIERISTSGIFLDSFVLRKPDDQGKLINLQHLSGFSILAHPQGKAHEAINLQVEHNGEAQLPESCDKNTTWVLGLAYPSIVTTMPIEQTETFASEKLQTRVHLLLHESSLNFTYGAPTSTLTQFDPKSMELSSPYSGSIRISHVSGHHPDPRFSIQTTSAENFQLLAITPEVAPRLDRRQSN